jgi:hypothetical protein
MAGSGILLCLQMSPIHCHLPLFGLYRQSLCFLQTKVDGHGVAHMGYHVEALLIFNTWDTCLSTMDSSPYMKVWEATIAWCEPGILKVHQDENVQTIGHALSACISNKVQTGWFSQSEPLTTVVVCTARVMA